LRGLRDRRRRGIARAGRKRDRCRNRTGARQRRDGRGAGALQEPHDRGLRLRAGQPVDARAPVRRGADHRLERRGGAGAARAVARRDGRSGARRRAALSRQAPFGDRLSHPGRRAARGEEIVSRLFTALVFALALAFAGTACAASKIEEIVSPGGIKAWLVRDNTVPLLSLDYAFTGGANADPADKPGLAHMVGALLDEGAGDLDSRTFQERMEEKAIQLGFTAARDQFRGSLRSLSANLGEAENLLRLALTAPRFDEEPVARIRDQLQAQVLRATTSPNDIASKRWWAEAFPDHPYGRPGHGTAESLALITVDDLKAYVRNTFA